MTQIKDTSKVTACPSCDLLIKQSSVLIGQKGCCPRCGTLITCPKKNPVTRTLAISATGLILFVPAIFSPLLSLDALGMMEKGSIFDGFVALYKGGYELVAIAVFLTSILLPFAKLLLLFFTSLCLYFSYYPRLLSYSLRSYHHFREWGMDEVYLIGVFVTLIKIYDIAHIRYQIGFFAFIGLAITTVCLTLFTDMEYFWQKIEKGKDGVPATLEKKAATVITARQAGLALCHDCSKLTPFETSSNSGIRVCPRCRATLHVRKSDSINKTLALLICAMIFLIPANILPIMDVNMLGSVERSTIMDGIVYFFQEGSYGIGVVILTASILVPLFKVIGLTIILLSVKLRRESWLRHQTIMFRFICFIGRWSMLDVFVIALLCVLVQFGTFSTITAAPAITFFTIVVILTMLAATTFDSRLLWDISSGIKANIIADKGGF